MKRFWLVMLALGLTLAFSAQAFAVDVKFSGSFYAAGMYMDKTTLSNRTNGSDNVSTAFYYQRLRVQTDFIVAPGLTLITRIDAMERAWGAPRSTAGTALDTGSAGTVAENENIAFDWAYISYDSPIGTFRAGYMDAVVWGTAFADSSTPLPTLAWLKTTGPWYYFVKIFKGTENSYTAKNTGATATDIDKDKYGAGVKYSWNGGEAGLLTAIVREATKRQSENYKGFWYELNPYAKAQLGPVKVQAEVYYAWGEMKKFDSGIGDIKLENLGIFLDAVADFNMFYAGGTFAYISGDDPTTTDKSEGGTVVNGGRDWNPCLIMFNYYDRTYWAGNLAGNGTSNAGPMGNDATTYSSASGVGFPGAWFGQGRIGVRPITALDIMASLSYAKADQKPSTILNSAFGWEVDVTGTYKITNNLSYMMGVGYWFVGDYYKGSSNDNAVQNNYMLINKLTLTF